MQLNLDLAKVSIAIFVRGIITQTVLRSDFVGDLRESSACILKRRRRKVLPARAAREFIHLVAREVVETSADVHALELSKSAEILIVFFLRGRHKQFAKT